MRRRDLVVLLGAVTFRSAARAQQPGTPIVGFLSSAADPDLSARAAFQQGMSEVGYIVGQNVSFEPPNPADRAPGVREETADRVHHKVNRSAAMTDTS